MLYRPFGQTGEQVSALGFGCMRLPVIDGRRDQIDVPLATEMLHYAIDTGSTISTPPIPTTAFPSKLPVAASRSWARPYRRLQREGLACDQVALVAR